MKFANFMLIFAFFCIEVVSTSDDDDQYDKIDNNLDDNKKEAYEGAAGPLSLEAYEHQPFASDDNRFSKSPRSSFEPANYNHRTERSKLKFRHYKQKKESGEPFSSLQEKKLRNFKLTQSGFGADPGADNEVERHNRSIVYTHGKDSSKKLDEKKWVEENLNELIEGDENDGFSFKNLMPLWKPFNTQRKEMRGSISHSPKAKGCSNKAERKQQQQESSDLTNLIRDNFLLLPNENKFILIKTLEHNRKSGQERFDNLAHDKLKIIKVDGKSDLKLTIDDDDLDKKKTQTCEHPCKKIDEDKNEKKKNGKEDKQGGSKKCEKGKNGDSKKGDSTKGESKKGECKNEEADAKDKGGESCSTTTPKTRTEQTKKTVLPNCLKKLNKVTCDMEKDSVSHEEHEDFGEQDDGNPDEPEKPDENKEEPGEKDDEKKKCSTTTTCTTIAAPTETTETTEITATEATESTEVADTSSTTEPAETITTTTHLETDNLEKDLKEEILSCTAEKLEKYLKSLKGKCASNEQQITTPQTKLPERRLHTVQDSVSPTRKLIDTESDAVLKSMLKHLSKADLLRLNITINGLVMKDEKPNQIRGNATINLVPATKRGQREERPKRGTKFLSKIKKIKNKKNKKNRGYEESSEDCKDEKDECEEEPKEREEKCDKEEKVGKKGKEDDEEKPDDKKGHKSTSSTSDTDFSKDSMSSYQISNEIIKMVNKMVHSNPNMKTLWPSLKRTKPGDGKKNPATLKKVCKGPGRKRLEDMIRRAMSSVNEIIEQEVQHRSCAPLSEELSNFYDLILALHVKQAKRTEQREERLNNSENLDDTGSTCEPDRSESSDDEAEINENSLFDMIHERKLKYDHEMSEARHSREALRRNHDLEADTVNSTLVRRLREGYSAAFLKLHEVADAIDRATVGGFEP